MYFKFPCYLKQSSRKLHFKKSELSRLTWKPKLIIFLNKEKNCKARKIAQRAACMLYIWEFQVSSTELHGLASPLRTCSSDPWLLRGISWGLPGMAEKKKKAIDKNILEHQCKNSQQNLANQIQKKIQDTEHHQWVVFSY